MGIVSESPALSAVGPSGEWLELEPDFVERHTKDMDVVFPKYKYQQNSEKGGDKKYNRNIVTHHRHSKRLSTTASKVADHITDIVS